MHTFLYVLPVYFRRFMEFNKMLKTIDRVMEIVKQTHVQGQKEYAHDEDNVFANFERVGSNLNMPREKALLVYLLKHMDGICSYVDGFEMQRDSFKGRITDAIVYLCLLWAMDDENIKQDAKN